MHQVRYASSEVLLYLRLGGRRIASPGLCSIIELVLIEFNEFDMHMERTAEPSQVLRKTF